MCEQKGAASQTCVNGGGANKGQRCLLVCHGERPASERRCARRSRNPAAAHLPSGASGLKRQKPFIVPRMASAVAVLSLKALTIPAMEPLSSL